MADQGHAVYDADLTYVDDRGGTHCGALTKEAFERCRAKANDVQIVARMVSTYEVDQ